jgi:hypothetical protein
LVADWTQTSSESNFTSKKASERGSLQMASSSRTFMLTVSLLSVLRQVSRFFLDARRRAGAGGGRAGVMECRAAPAGMSGHRA